MCFSEAARRARTAPRHKRAFWEISDFVVDSFRPLRTPPEARMRRTSMYRHRLLGAVLLSAATIGPGIGVGTVWAAPASPQERVDAAYKAIGMTDAITTLVVKGR